MDNISIIKNSFEKWYNATVSTEHPVSIVINYSDMQTLSIKAFHKITVEMQAIEIADNKPRLTPIIKIEENYNHGIMSEEDAKSKVLEKLLIEIYSHIKML